MSDSSDDSVSSDRRSHHRGKYPKSPKSVSQVWEDEQPASSVPAHMRNLVESLGCRNLDLTNIEVVNQFIARRREAVENEADVKRITRLLALEAAMRISSTFSGVDVALVRGEINGTVRSRPALLEAAEKERRKQIVGQLIDNSLLVPETDGNLLQRLLHRN